MKVIQYQHFAKWKFALSIRNKITIRPLSLKRKKLLAASNNMYRSYRSFFEMYVARHQVKKKRNIPNPFLVRILFGFWCMGLEAQVLFRVIDNLIPN